MKKIDIEPRDGFHVIGKTKSAEAATMVIEPGNAEGGPDNKHDADQWLFVLSGTGEAVVDGQTTMLSAGQLLEIEAGETHEIRAKGKKPL